MSNKLHSSKKNTIFKGLKLVKKINIRNLLFYYRGVKPTTLQQMQNNKKQRSEEEFNKMFFQPQVVSSDKFNRGATKY
jgi:hypothetical protein